MNCKNCKKELRTDDIFCPRCGIKIEKKNCKDEINVNSYGINSPNIGNGSGNIIDIENLNIGTKENNSININFTKKMYDFAIKEKTIKKIRFIPLLFSITSFVSSVITIIDSDSILNPIFGKLMIAGLIFFLIFILFSIFIKKISEQEFIYINIFWWLPSIIFILDENRKIRRIKIKGKCNICNGNIELYRDEETGNIIGICKKNRNHKYRFDHTNFTGKEI